MFNLKKRKKTKKLEEFELLEINLIRDTPLNYAYVMHKSDRVIQKENKELLMEIVLENPYSAEYIKLGPEKDFVLTESVPELNGIFAKFKRRKAFNGLLQNLIYIVAFILFFFVFGQVEEEFEKDPLFWVICLMTVVYPAINIYKLFKYRPKS